MILFSQKQGIKNSLSGYCLRSQRRMSFCDGERRYSLTLLQLCQHEIAQKMLPDWLRLRLENKISQQAENPRSKYEKLVPHALGGRAVVDGDNYTLKAMNAALRRSCLVMCRRTNTYAKNRPGLRRALDLHVSERLLMGPLVSSTN